MRTNKETQLVQEHLKELLEEEVSESGSRVSRGVMTHGRGGPAGFARTSEGNPSYPNAMKEGLRGTGRCGGDRRPS